MANITAIDNAWVWYNTAQAAIKGGIYTTALYSMEMAVEIALKAVLVEFGINVPKLHNVMNVLRVTFEEKRGSLPEKFKNREEFILDIYNNLLEIRPLVGYAFEMGASIDPKKKTIEYITRTKEVIDLCELAIRHLEDKR